MSDTFWLGYQVFRLGLWPTRHSLPWSVSLPPSFAYQSVFPAPKRVYTITSNEAGAEYFSKCGDIGRGAAVASWQEGVDDVDGISEGWNTFLQVQYWQLISKKLFWAFDKFDLFYSLRMYQRWLPGREQFAHGAGGISRRGASLRRCEWWELSWKPEPSRQPPPPPADWPPSLEDVPNITITPSDYWHSMETIANYSGRILIGLSWHMSLLRTPLRTSSSFPGNEMS